MCIVSTWGESLIEINGHDQNEKEIPCNAMRCGNVVLNKKEEKVENQYDKKYDHKIRRSFHLIVLL
jgi:hypothetical protein